MKNRSLDACDGVKIDSRNQAEMTFCRFKDKNSAETEGKANRMNHFRSTIIIIKEKRVRPIHKNGGKNRQKNITKNGVKAVFAVKGSFLGIVRHVFGGRQ